jgi:hypothetical protein
MRAEYAIFSTYQMTSHRHDRSRSEHKKTGQAGQTGAPIANEKTKLRELGLFNLKESI